MKTKTFDMGAFLATDDGRVALEHPGTGRWYIAMGYAGFNSPANNRDGYVTCEAAMRAHRRYAGPDHGIKIS